MDHTKTMERTSEYYEDKLNDMSFDLARLMKARAFLDDELKSMEEGSVVHTDILEEIRDLSTRINHTVAEMDTASKMVVKYSAERITNG